MAFHNLFRPKGRLVSSRRRRRKTEAGSSLLRFLETNRVVAAGIFILTVAAIFTISFVGVSPAGFHILPNQEATVRITADVGFSYRSELLTARKRERALKEVPPVFQVDLQPVERFEASVRQLLGDLANLDPRWSGLGEAERLGELTTIAEAFSRRSNASVGARDLTTIVNAGDAAARGQLVENGLFVLREIHRGGIFDPENALVPLGERELMVFHLKRDQGEASPSRVQSLEDAVQNLRINLAGENVQQTVAAALYRLLRGGVRENIVFDQKESDALRDRVLLSLRDIVRTVEPGETIVEAGTRVSHEQYEMLVAYQRFLNTSNSLPSGIDQQTIGRILLVLGVIIVAAIYVRLEDAMTLRSNGRLALLALVLVFSLGGVRATFEAGNLPVFADDPATAALLPYVAPTAFAPIIIAVLIGAGPALFCGLLVSVFSAIIFGNRFDVLVLSLLTTSVAAFASRAVRRRSRLVRAGWLSGVALSAFVVALGWTEEMGLGLVIKAMVGGQATGLITGILVVGLLPLLEALFKRTTDITLLELTDYNHPLLRRMQMDAPGTYHHSLMVANLAENAANAIGANALLCRVCSMFHDIGKLVKPEYFSENQRGGINPHAERSPSLSALIIKSHVKEGVDLAIKHKLPRPIIDVIRQHHGTTLIRYFYEAARRRARTEREQAPANGPVPDPQSDNPAIFRYDGPRPQTRESAVILCADSVEAASRSLQKVTPQAVEELIDAIIREKIADHQIDEAPLTIQEVDLVKRSFTHTLLNSLHSRVVYPKAEPPTAVQRPFREASPVHGTPASPAATTPVGPAQ